MDTVTILRQLWRFRFLVIVVALVSVFAGLAVTFKLPSTESRKYEVGVATARLLLDTPASQVVDVAPKGSDVLGARATLLANLMVDGEIKTAIARQAGVSPAKLAGLNDSAQVAATAPLDPRGFQIGTKVLTATGGDSLPIIEVDAQAPTAAGAEKLANAAITGLRSYLDAKAVAE
ncbi:MAG TPA: hypothetical protein VNS09_19630, partial [Solirubrobacter sp.]|nr:hypothetical protein [Solirubrobacter sp.]